VSLGEENPKEEMQFQSGDENNRSVSNVWFALSSDIKRDCPKFFVYMKNRKKKIVWSIYTYARKNVLSVFIVVGVIQAI
jgi:hypothetical protein